MTTQKTESLSEEELSQFETHVKKAVAIIADQSGNQQSGGVLHLRGQDGVELINKSVGSPVPERLAEFSFFAAEKTERLHHHKDHILSWQSQDVPLKRYQGAVRAPNGFVASFSGLSGDEDETLALWAFFQMGWMTGQQTHDAAKLSRNQQHSVWLRAFTGLI